MTAPLLEVEALTIGIRRRGQDDVRIVEDLSFAIQPGERFGIVGESGSGKSLTLRAVAGLLPKGVEVLSGAIRYNGQDLGTMSATARRRLMGPQIAMVFQEPMTALNPVVRVGEQIAEGPRRHLGLSRQAAADLAIEMMRRTGIPDPARRARAYPHELSGGLRQRIMIAMALSCSPRLLLCDEPTTALDVTVQHQVLQLIEELCVETGTALAFVTHDLAVVNQTCTGSRGDVLRSPGRGRPRQGGLPRPAAPLHARPAGVRPGLRRPRPCARPDPGVPAERRSASDRMSVRAPLPVRRRGVHDGDAPAGVRGPRPHRRLHPHA
jgi:ABC-type glutathione transport system ATPase component